MGVILFLMVTGSLPYTSEANINDALYKLIFQRKRDLFWRVWREFNLLDDNIVGIPDGGTGSSISPSKPAQQEFSLKRTLISVIASIPAVFSSGVGYFASIVISSGKTLNDKLFLPCSRKVINACKL
jgi:hypothetical protein